jgi:ketosteroid isomerase-like protein
MTDREAIQQLMATYAYAIDAKDYAGITDCFTEDATVEYAGHSHRLTGHAAIAKIMEQQLGPLDVTQHMFTNFIIQTDGDTGRVSCDILAQHVRRGALGGDKYMAGGQYRVEVRHTSAGWKISGVAARTLWNEGNPDLLNRV